jgi:pimeloyl-ACP methyl ester carboxylesterase
MSDFGFGYGDPAQERAARRAARVGRSVQDRLRMSPRERWSRAALTLTLVFLLAGHATAQDYAREKRWADEIVPAVVVGDPVYIQQTRGRNPSHKFLALFAEAPNAKTAVVLVHGVGVHPDHGIIGALRVKLNDAGYTTLAIQMPVAGSEAKVEDYYPVVFDEAANRITIAAKWLQEKGYGQLVLLSHSMGAWMANEYLLNADSVPYAAWICMGITGRITGPSSIRIPTLDLYGENDLDNARRAAPWRRLMKMFMASGSEQVEVAGADHFYTGKENVAAAEIEKFLRGRQF